MREFATSPIVRAVNRVGYMLCAAGVVMLAACGGDDVDVAPTTTAVVVTTVPPVNETTTTVSFTEISEAVFAAMSDGSAEALASVIGVVTPGSPADIAVRHQIKVAELAAIAEDEIAAVPTTTSTTAEVGSTTSTMTAPETMSTAVDGCESTNTCTVYGTPVFDDEGGLRSFSVNGVPLEQVVIGPGPLSVAEMVQARVVSAYRAPSGVTAVLVSVTAADEALTIFGFAAIHRPLTSADLQPVETLGSWGADQIAAGQSGETLLVFPDTTLDGDVVLTVVTSSSIDLELKLALITP